MIFKKNSFKALYMFRLDLIVNYQYNHLKHEKLGQEIYT